MSLLNKKKKDTSLFLYKLIEQSNDEPLTFYLHNGKRITGKVHGVFREDDDTIWQWDIQILGIKNFTSVLIKHAEIIKVKFENSDTTFSL